MTTATKTETFRVGVTDNRGQRQLYCVQTNRIMGSVTCDEGDAILGEMGRGRATRIFPEAMTRVCPRCNGLGTTQEQYDSPEIRCRRCNGAKAVPARA